MSPSIPDSADLRQDPRYSKRLVDAAFITPVAEALYRFDRRKHDVSLSELDFESQQRYRDDAAVLAYMRDKAEATPAFYFAVSLLTKGALGSMPRHVRQALVAMLDVSFCAFRKALAVSKGVSYRELDQLAKLAAADTQAGQAAAAATKQPIEAVDLRDLVDIATGQVH